jgi:hypothetical protein
MSVCRQCTEKYIIGSNQDPHCMNPSCGVKWDFDFLTRNFTKVFVGTDLKDHRRHLLFQRELSLLPHTQPLVEDYLMEQKNTQEIKELMKRKKELADEVKQLTAEIHKLQASTRKTTAAANTEKRMFIRACPSPECRGFLSTQWKCGLCEIWVCPDCHEVKGRTRDAEHTCLPENLETAKMIAANAKSCPSCGAMSCKVEGCSQVFCISCKVAWDWNTGKVDKGPIHAVDYFDFIKRMGIADRQHGDVPCGGMPLPRRITTALNNFQVPKETATEIIDVQRRLIHLYEVDGRHNNIDVIGDNVDLRIRYMAKEIDEAHFKRMLVAREKAYLKKKDIYQAIRTTYDIGCEIYRQITVVRSKERLVILLNELQELLVISKTSMDNIAQKFTCKVPAVPDFKNNL